ncbi:hypothetical protein E2C01_075294 [Portunus trituberculatus]|uniref:Uncharacterized protein n=1 Tax=Portunus trituberculatus TaxID=210409 RepID=A0A5B7IFH4_PORTR|nr:hypothetical protein [Portunus trituberculatus]
MMKFRSFLCSLRRPRVVVYDDGKRRGGRRAATPGVAAALNILCKLSHNRLREDKKAKDPQFLPAHSCCSVSFTLLSASVLLPSDW